MDRVDTAFELSSRQPDTLPRPLALATLVRGAGNVRRCGRGFYSRINTRPFTSIAGTREPPSTPEVPPDHPAGPRPPPGLPGVSRWGLEKYDQLVICTPLEGKA